LVHPEARALKNQERPLSDQPRWSLVFLKGQFRNSVDPDRDAVNVAPGMPEVGRS
jgi:hypothetical protein